MTDDAIEEATLFYTTPGFAKYPIDHKTINYNLE